MKNAFPDLHIPSFAYQIREYQQGYQIFDVSRKAWFVLTPEEWVRQHVIHFLLSQGYPKGLTQVESEHCFQERKKRTDILVFDRKGEPFLVVECKASHISLSSKTFSQVAVYNYCIDAPFVMITNGLQIGVFEHDKQAQTYHSINYLPSFPD